MIGGEPLISIHYNERSRLDQAMPRLEAAIRLELEAPPGTPLIRDVLHSS